MNKYRNDYIDNLDEDEYDNTQSILTKIFHITYSPPNTNIPKILMWYVTYTHLRYSLFAITRQVARLPSTPTFSQKLQSISWFTISIEMPKLYCTLCLNLFIEPQKQRLIKFQQDFVFFFFSSNFNIFFHTSDSPDNMNALNWIEWR